MNIPEMIAKARAAQEIFESYTNEEIDNVLKAVAKIVYENSTMLGTEAYEETKMGVLQNKIQKARNVPVVTYYFCKGQKALGLIDVDTEKNMLIYAKPAGVAACITPSTNPIATPAGNCISALKSGNAVIVCPHPAAKKCTKHTIDLMRQALESVGAPADLLQVVEEPTTAISGEVMKACDVVMATGGKGMVTAAYSSGTPAIGVGQGNVQCLICDDFDNIDLATSKIIYNREFDDGVPCTGDQTVYIPASREAEILASFEKNGAVIVDKPEDVAKIRDFAFQNGILNRAIVGKSAQTVAKLTDLPCEVAPEKKILLVKLESPYDREDPLNREVLCPVLRYRVYESFEDAVKTAVTNLKIEGAGHSSNIWSNDQEKVRYAGSKLPVGRLIVNSANINAGGTTFATGLDPTITIGCGFWGGNSISENLTFRHLRNYTRVAYPLTGRVVPPADELFAD